MEVCENKLKIFAMAGKHMFLDNSGTVRLLNQHFFYKYMFLDNSDTGRLLNQHFFYKFNSITILLES